MSEMLPNIKKFELKPVEDIKDGQVLVKPIFSKVSEFIEVKNDQNSDNGIVVLSSIPFAHPGEHIQFRQHSQEELTFKDGNYYLLDYEDIIGFRKA